MAAENPSSDYLVWLLAASLFLASGLLAVLASLLERSGSIRRRHWAEEASGRLQRLHESDPHFAAFRFLLSLLARLMPLLLVLALLGLPLPLSPWLPLALVVVWLGLVEGQLQGGIPVLLFAFHLNDGTGTGFHYRDRDQLFFFVVDLSHPEFFTDEIHYFVPRLVFL